MRPWGSKLALRVTGVVGRIEYLRTVAPKTIPLMVLGTWTLEDPQSCRLVFSRFLRISRGWLLRNGSGTPGVLRLKISYA